MLAIPRSPIAGLAYQFKRVPPLLAVPGIPPARLVGRDIRLRYVGEGVEPAPCGRVGALRPPSGDGVNTLSDQLAGRRSGFPCLGQRHTRKAAESHQVRLAVEFEPVKPRPVARAADQQIESGAVTISARRGQAANLQRAQLHRSQLPSIHLTLCRIIHLGKHYRSGCPSTGRASGGKCSPDFRIVQRLREVGGRPGSRVGGDSPSPLVGEGRGGGITRKRLFAPPRKFPLAHLQSFILTIAHVTHPTPAPHRSGAIHHHRPVPERRRGGDDGGESAAGAADQTGRGPAPWHPAAFFRPRRPAPRRNPCRAAARRHGEQAPGPAAAAKLPPHQLRLGAAAAADTAGRRVSLAARFPAQ